MLDLGVYQWVVLAAAFSSHALLGMVLESSGALHVIFLKAFNGGSGDTALATSLVCATFYGIAPVTGVLVINYPCWKMAMIGALLGGLGVVLTSFINTLMMLYATFGILAGIGLGMAYMPAITSISQVFDKHRTVAFSIASSGVGIGKFVGPVVIGKMEEEYGWRGAVLLLGGITLNLCICAAVYHRPSVAMFKIPTPYDEEENINDNTKPYAPVDERVTKVKDDSVTMPDNVKDLNVRTTNGVNGVGNLANGVISKDRFGYTDNNYSLAVSDVMEAAQPQRIILPLLNGHAGAPPTQNGFAGTPPTRNGFCGTPTSGTEISESEIIENFKRDLAIEGNLTSIAAALSTSSLFLSTTDAISVEHLPSNKIIYRCKINGSVHSHLYATPTRHGHSRQVSTQDLTSANDVSKMRLDDLSTTPKTLSALTICKTPSRLSIPLPEDDDLLPMPTSTGGQTSEATQKKKGFKLNIFLMQDPKFLILCLNNFLFAIGYALTHVHLPAFSIHAGQSVYHGNLLVSAIGISSLVGKITLGWTSQLPGLSPMSVYTTSSMMAAIATELVPACNTFAPFLSYAVFFGFVSGSFGAVLPSLVLSMTTVELLPSAYGFLLVFEAAGYLLGPSVGGWLYDGTGLYASSFFFGGSAMLIASLIMLYPWYCQRKAAAALSPVINEENNEPVQV